MRSWSFHERTWVVTHMSISILLLRIEICLSDVKIRCLATSIAPAILSSRASGFCPFAILFREENFSRSCLQIFQGVVYVAIWAIWDWHNRVLDTSSSCLHEDIFAKVQTLSLLWLSNRSRKNTLDWRNWVLNPSCTMDIDPL